MDKKELGLKIKFARKQYSQTGTIKMTQKTLAEKINVSRSYIGDIESGRTYPTFIVLKAIAEACKVPISFLTESELKGVELEESSATDAYHLAAIPILGIIQAGEPKLAYQNIIGYEYLPSEMANSGTYFGLRVIGDSMNNSRIFDGDIVIVRCQEDVENGEIAVVLVNGENATVKKFFKSDAIITLMPDSSNRKHQPQFIDPAKTDIKVLGKVIKVIINI